jgi:hypothetical protein
MGGRSSSISRCCSYDYKASPRTVWRGALGVIVYRCPTTSVPIKCVLRSLFPSDSPLVKYESDGTAQPPPILERATFSIQCTSRARKKARGYSPPRQSHFLKTPLQMQRPCVLLLNSVFLVLSFVGKRVNLRHDR